MNKLKHIAVVLRGHVRTWHFNAPKVFEFYDSVAENVDYYFITWDSSNTDDIEETFKNKNLIYFQILNQQLENGRWYNGHLGPPFMNQMILPHLKRQEKKINQQYDCIFDTRPDVLPSRLKIIFGDNAGNNISITPPEPNTVYITGLELHTNTSSIKPQSGMQDIALQDWFLYMGSDEFEKLCMRYHPDKFLYELRMGPGTQIELREYISYWKMFLCVQDWSKGHMTRPPVYKLDWLDSNNIDILIETSNSWPSLKRDEKIALCERYGISLSDYVDTPSITCKI